MRSMSDYGLLYVVLSWEADEAGEMLMSGVAR